MQCSCGEETKSAKHEVKTLKKAQEWYPLVEESNLPILVDQDFCPACGRAMATIEFASGTTVKRG